MVMGTEPGSGHASVVVVTDNEIMAALFHFRYV